MDVLKAGGVVVTVGLVLMAILVGSPLSVFFCLPSLLLVGLGGAAAWRLSSGADIGRMRATLASERPSVGALARALVTARSSRRALWLAAGASIGVGLIQMLARIDDPTAVGPALAVALLGPLYALLIDALIVAPRIQRVVDRAAEQGEADPVAERVAGAARAARSRASAGTRR